MHNSNAGNNLGLVVGPNGSGKSWLLGWVAETLGVRPNGNTDLFDTSNLNKHVFFDSKSFMQRATELTNMSKRKTVGTQLILDEGQLSLYSKDAFKDEVKNLSRMLMTIRSRRWGVYINLPTFGMLNKDVRMITNWLVQMKGKPLDYSYGTFYTVDVNMISGEPFIKKPVFSSKEYTEDGMPYIVDKAYSILPFPQPSNKFIIPYEKMKNEHQKELYEKYGALGSETKNGSKVEEKVSLDKMIISGLSNKTKLVNSHGRLVATKVASFFSITPNTKLHMDLVKGLLETSEFKTLN